METRCINLGLWDSYSVVSNNALYNASGANMGKTIDRHDFISVHGLFLGG